MIILGIEKRKYPRAKVNLKIIVSDSEGKYLHDSLAEIFNLSIGGARFQSRINFNKKEKVSLIFTHKRQHLKVIGTVLWKEEGEYVSTYRVIFLNLNFFKKIILKRFIKLYLGEASTTDKSLVFWGITFLVLLMYLFSKACVFLPLGFILIIIVVVVFCFYLWILIKGKKR